MTKATISDLRDKLLVDRNNLDEELIQQPSLYFDISEQSVFARSRRDLAELDAKNIGARLDREIREDAVKAGDKITEAGVKAAIEDTDEMKAARLDCLHKSEEVAQLEALREAFSQRGHALKHLVELFLAGYFQRSSASAAHGSVMDGLADRSKKEAGAARKAARVKAED